MKPTYFPSAAAFRAWLEEHHAHASELVVGFRKTATGKPSMTWSESVDEALCFGWIDGVRKRVDAERYQIRFTPRKPGSTWSAINVAKIAALEAAGRMHPAGRAAFETRSDKKTGIYSYEQREQAVLDASQEERFRANRAAWQWWMACAPGYRKVATYWVQTAKRAETREKRLETLIADCAKGVRIAPLRVRKGTG